MMVEAGAEPLLTVEGLTVRYPAGVGRWLHAVSGVGFRIDRGEVLGLVGESGCGKSSVARAVMQLPRPAAGRVVLEGEDLASLSGEKLRRLRSRFQMVFQDPAASLNPARNVGESVAEALRAGGLSRAERTDRARAMMAAVGLDPERYYGRRPFQLSGGQCQRVSIARALVTDPSLLVCDEPVSSLDVSVQAQILNLLREVKERCRMGMLFISHDLAVVKNICSRVAVMYLGVLCETGETEEMFRAPAHPYTAGLLDAVPRPDPRRPLADSPFLPGELPSAIYPPSGCRFRTRCPRAGEPCRMYEPSLQEISPGHSVACHFPLAGE